MIANVDFENECLACYGRVLHLGQRMLGSRAAAEEVAQDTYLKAFQKRASYRGESSVSTWVLSIAYRLCLDHGRRTAGQPLDWEPVDETGPRAREAHQESRELLAQLSERSRSVLILRAGLELSYAEIGRVLGVPLNQVGVYLQRARKEALQIAKAERLL